MDGGSSALFVGDLGDPWVASIASALPAGSARLHCPDALPDAWPLHALRAPVVVVHRATLGPADLDRLRRLRDRDGDPPRLVLCAGPLARYHHLQSWAMLVDSVLPEATASAVIVRHVRPAEARRLPPTPGPVPVVVVSTNHDLRLTLADACRRAGYEPRPARDWRHAPAGGLAIWDVHDLEPDWPRRLAQATYGRRLVALLNFPDRRRVSVALARGAARCLELPCDPEDLIFVLDDLRSRIPATLNVDPAHPVPATPHIHARAVGARVVGMPGEPYNP